ncbi:hypothetical protein L3Q65_15435 [Amycolatopsis sp. FU40]|uniref:hypothetical protein n=1 Tax=Amycolatopsis sp. FU40 TaxID=2914159 RepID=UPI001F194E44|nr:hypothetical protein [Amycolatopsis sp. FU40]UKD58058.1 hypothetical protein L3Q65_15435 [Amycolatopsis sp. FU40]
MDNVIDLDAAVREIDRRRGVWQGLGIAAGETTWRDQGEEWPHPFKTGRAAVVDADSIGVELAKGPQRGSIVLFTGGWADFAYGDGDDLLVQEAPGWGDPLDVGKFAGELDRLTKLFA